MSDDPRAQIRDAYLQIKTAERLLKDGLQHVSTALQTVGACEDTLLKDGIAALPPCDAPVTDHRRTHRPGRPPKIDQDPELQSFILARIDRLTYQEIANDVTRHFPAGRRVSKSTIHAWNQRRTKRRR